MAEPLLHAFAKPTKTDFIRIVRGSGALLWDDKGNEYIDAIGSLWYSQVGHGNAEIAEAVAEQIRTLETYSIFDPFTNEMAEQLAAKRRKDALQEQLDAAADVEGSAARAAAAAARKKPVGRPRKEQELQACDDADGTAAAPGAGAGGGSSPGHARQSSRRFGGAGRSWLAGALAP